MGIEKPVNSTMVICDTHIVGTKVISNFFFQDKVRYLADTKTREKTDEFLRFCEMDAT